MEKRHFRCERSHPSETADLCNLVILQFSPAKLSFFVRTGSSQAFRWFLDTLQTNVRSKKADGCIFFIVLLFSELGVPSKTLLTVELSKESGLSP